MSDIEPADATDSSSATDASPHSEEEAELAVAMLDYHLSRLAAVHGNGNGETQGRPEWADRVRRTLAALLRTEITSGALAPSEAVRQVRELLDSPVLLIGDPDPTHLRLIRYAATDPNHAPLRWLVQELTWRRAARANASGLFGQIEFILSHVDIEEAERLLDTESGSPVLTPRQTAPWRARHHRSGSRGRASRTRAAAAGTHPNQ
ncbi:hypothetical protein [Nocardia blacklockiae]|uniref:hypothetical protein n=1 Tax=Nocardia blacklockiae TaxID=480036 RepID=UPI0018937712|nr:hypothetical protein [Nocardia blacklockiae]MBF6171105.1 hypothetical protein [Nocardia blacklockiae]